MRRIRMGVCVVVLLVLTVACQSQAEESAPFLVSPLSTVSVLASPVGTPVTAAAPVFEISEPVYAGDATVQGTGPTGVPIKLVDVTEIGAELDRTVIGDGGMFSFNLVEGLPEGHTIGLQIGDLAGTSLRYEDFERSETYYDRPLIGVLFDMVSVQERP